MNSALLQIRLLLLRQVMIRRSDPYVPNRCNAKYYKIGENDTCECKIWCKFPPPGSAAAVMMNKKVPISLKDQLM